MRMGLTASGRHIDFQMSTSIVLYIFALLQCRCSTRSAKLGLPLAARSVLSALRYLSTGISAPNLCEVSDGSLFYFPTRTASGDKT
jgi:hypothetical protein